MYEQLFVTGPHGAALCVLAVVLSGAACMRTSQDVTGSTLQASPTRLVADGKATAVVTVAVKGKGGNAHAGVNVRLAADKCLINQPTAPTSSTGKASGSIASTVVGTHTVTATVDGSDLHASLSASIDLEFVDANDTSAITVTAGDNLDLNVAARDSHGLPDAAFAGTVRFTSSDPQATLPAPYTFSRADAGSALFPHGLILRTAGSQTVSATDVHTDIVIQISNYIVLAAAVDHIALVGSGSVVAGQPTTLVLKSVDAYQNPVALYSGIVYLSSSDSQAVLPNDVIFDLAEQGSHPITVVLKTAGVQWIRTSDLSASLHVGETTVSVQPTAVEQLVLSGPTIALAGSPLDFVLTARDAFGNSASYLGTVHLASTDPHAVLPNDYAFSPADGGMHIFSAGIELRTAGTRAITATDVANPSLATVQGDIQVTAASASLFDVTGIRSGTAGTVSSVIVTTHDAFGNSVADYAGTMTFSSSDAQALLPASYTFANTDHGRHTFVDGVMLKTSGGQSVTATDAANATMTGSQSDIMIKPAAATTLVISGLPSAVVAGQTHFFDITAQDPYGNRDTQYVGVAHFSSTDPQASAPAPMGLFAGTQTLDHGAIVFKTAGTQSLSATTVQAPSLQGSFSVGVQPGALDSAVSTVVAAPALLPADGNSTSTVFVSAQDSFGNALAGLPVSLQLSWLGDAAVPASGSTDANGIFAATVKASYADVGVQRILAILAGRGIGNSVTFTPYVSAPTYATTAIALATGDIDGDGQVDFVGVSEFRSWPGSELGLEVFLNQGGGRFGLPIKHPMAVNPNGLALCDTNGDGQLDVIVGSAADNAVRVLINLGHGMLATPALYDSLGVGVFDVATGDINGDGRCDIVTANKISDTVSVLINTGTGYTAQVTAATGVYPTAVAVADLNGDGQQDIATSGANATSVFLNAGQGILTGPLTYAVPGGFDCALGDVSGDGNTDIVVHGPDFVTLLSNQGNGTFTPSAMPAASPWYRRGWVAVGDVNEDGRLDMLTTDDTGLHIITNAAAASLTLPASEVNYDDVALADVNGDGHLDVIALTGVGARVLFNAGYGHFPNPVTYTAGTAPLNVVAADISGDGKPDLLTGNTASANIGVFLNRGDGTFAQQIAYATAPNPNALAVGDLNGDGVADVVVTSSGNVVGVLRNQGGGTFAPSTPYSVGTNPNRVAIGDVTGDGKTDIVVTNTGSNTISVLAGAGNGNFATQVIYGVGSSPCGLALADINADGKADVVVANSGSSSISALIQKSNGTLTPAVSYAVAGAFWLALGDMNGDGRPDIVGRADAYAAPLSILLNLGGGTFGSAITYGGGGFAFALGDINGDGSLDVVVALGGALLNQGNATFLQQQAGPFWSCYPNECPKDVALGDFNGDSKLDTVYAWSSGLTVLVHP